MNFTGEITEAKCMWGCKRHLRNDNSYPCTCHYHNYKDERDKSTFVDFEERISRLERIVKNWPLAEVTVLEFNQTQQSKSINKLNEHIARLERICKKGLDFEHPEISE